MFREIKCEQGSDEWYQARLGKWTASFFDKAITKTGKKSASSADIVNRLVAEKIVGNPDDTFQSDAMLRGKELESEALDFLNFTHNLSFRSAGFLDSEKGYGCSPDALDDSSRLGLELKCPSLHTHLEYLAGEELPGRYKAQVQGSMMVTGFDRWFFCSYFPGIPPLVVSVERDEKYIKTMLEIIEPLCREVDDKYNRLMEKIDGGAI